MKLHTLSALLVALWLVGAGPARGAPVLSFEYTGSGQTVSLTSPIVVGGRITNTGDTSFHGVQSIFRFLIPQPAYDQYLWVSGGFPTAPTFIDLDPGESISWVITTLGTWPITGARGDPVPAGDYFLGVTALEITYAVWDPIIGPTNERYSVSAPPTPFVWTAAPASNGVPAPSIMLLILSGLTMLLVPTVRRRVTARG